jgi:hypothetical protein
LKKKHSKRGFKTKRRRKDRELKQLLHRLPESKLKPWQSKRGLRLQLQKLSREFLTHLQQLEIKPDFSQLLKTENILPLLKSNRQHKLRKRRLHM